MITIKICIGSSCFLKGASKIVDYFKKRIEEEKLTDRIELQGNFCTGKCNRVGVTLYINDKLYIGVTPEKLNEFWKDNILPLI